MILVVSLDYVQQHVAKIKASGKSYVRWQYERGANYVHAQMSALDREHVRQELEIVADFKSALRQTYPDRSFVICHIPCYAVSFYQTAEGAPTEGILPVRGEERGKDQVWCQTCECKQPYHPLPSPDAEFPQAEWGVCEVCGNDVITFLSEVLTLLPAVE